MVFYIIRRKKTKTNLKKFNIEKGREGDIITSGLFLIDIFGKNGFLQNSDFTPYIFFFFFPR